MRWCVLLAGLLMAGCSVGITVLDRDDEDCVPVTCEEVGAECGEVGIGCAFALDCGVCPGEVACGEQQPFRCDALCPSTDTEVVSTTRFCDYPSTFEVWRGAVYAHTAFPAAPSPGRSHLLRLGRCPEATREVRETASDVSGGSDVLAVSGDVLWVTSRRGGNVLALGLGADEPVEVATEIDDPCAIEAGPSDVYLLTCAFDAPRLLRVDPQDGAVTALADLDAAPSPRAVFALDGGLFWADRDGALQRYDLEGGSVSVAARLETGAADVVRSGGVLRVLTRDDPPRVLRWTAGALADEGFAPPGSDELAANGARVFVGGSGGVFEMTPEGPIALDARPVQALFATETELYGTTRTSSTCHPVDPVTWVRTLP